ncbi:DNA-binding response regulator, NarL/FixJ family, contains REC and HTH domains [Marisediminitalea aggregata]|uniref:DNA-binding response regulator, NarL/FixJ family, contains REC and HTH domains n=1 Tax=Marisediminitalea aggregata TaxID=634436 RepID=A0A1M5JYU3_9ALTE|nr:response regulator transcription factor [Marisediminitalea aggregata]MCP5011946.1 response regulator transcription factor [Aestuariibacter sp.]SHG45470.1 DNA-binding response regulator, NarL/FixJ family, contains REC and HTH domains [Marisediminitalea aggregata]
MDTTILIADDHPLFRAAMRQALVDIVGDSILEVASFSEAYEAVEEHDEIELVFLDLNMPGNEGLTGLTELRTQFPSVLVVIVSAEEDPTLIRRAIDLGASGYIPKSTPLPQIADAVNKVLDGEQWLPGNINDAISQLENKQDKAFADKLAQLTPHQFKVLKMMADGLLNKQIAYELDISESTVKQHVSAVLRKLEVINRTKAGVLFKQMMNNEENH